VLTDQPFVLNQAATTLVATTGCARATQLTALSGGQTVRWLVLYARSRQVSAAVTAIIVSLRWPEFWPTDAKTCGSRR
jgi:hypothetical protein